MADDGAGRSTSDEDEPPARARRRPARSAALVAVALVLALLGALFWRVVVHGETFGDRDLAAYYYPAKSLVAPLARASEGIPLWNPFFSSGQPFAANPEHELFHPMTTLFFLLPFELAYRLQIILPLVVAFASMVFLLRVLRRSRPAALFGAMTWAFGGYLLSTTNLLPILYGAAVLPLALGFAIRLLRAPRALDVAWLAICVGLQWLAGEPTMMIMLPVLLGAAVATAWRPGIRRGVLAIGLGLGLSLGIGAVTLLPGAHHFGKTDRARGLTPTETGQWSMPPIRVLELFSPHVLGHVLPTDERLYWGRHLYPGRESPFFYSLYPGLAVTALALALPRRRARALLPWLVAAALGYLYAIGTHFPLWHALRHLPVLSGLRFPEKGALLVVVPLVIFAAHGFDAVVMGPARPRRWLGRALLALAGVAALAAALAALLGAGSPSALVWRAAAWDLLRVLVVALSVPLVLWLLRRHGHALRGFAVCGVLLVDLASAGRGVIHTRPVAALRSPPAPLVPLIRQAPDASVFHAAAWEPSLAKVKDVGQPPRTAQWGLATTLEAEFDLTFLRWSNEGARAFFAAVHGDPSLAMPLLQRRGTGAVVQLRPGSHWQGDFFAGPDGQSPLEVRTVADPQPVVFAARYVEAVRGSEGWLAAVRRLGLAARDSVLVDDARFVGPAGPPAPADVQVRGRQPGGITLDVDGKGPGPSFVAFNQTWDEGWQLAIDDIAAPLLRVDISLSGFVLPPGRHRVSMVYEDPWLRAGLFISALGTVSCLGLALWGRRRQPGPSVAAHLGDGP